MDYLKQLIDLYVNGGATGNIVHHDFSSFVKFNPRIIFTYGSRRADKCPPQFYRHDKYAFYKARSDKLGIPDGRLKTGPDRLHHLTYRRGRPLGITRNPNWSIHPSLNGLVLKRLFGLDVAGTARRTAHPPIWRHPDTDADDLNFFLDNLRARRRINIDGDVDEVGFENNFA